MRDDGAEIGGTSPQGIIHAHQLLQVDEFAGDHGGAHGHVLQAFDAAFLGGDDYLLEGGCIGTVLRRDTASLS